MIVLMLAALVVPAVEPAKCVPQQPQLVDNDHRAAPKKLDQLPPAQHYLTVYRAIDNCPAPVIVRYGIGNKRR